MPIANIVAAPKLEAIAAVQAAAVISFSPDTVTFAILFTEVGFMGQATSRDKCLQLCWVGSGRARVVEFDMNQTCRRPGRRRGCVWSGPVRVQSGPVWSGRVRVVECGLYIAPSGPKSWTIF